MGITLTANGSPWEFDMGYGAFFSLRKNIALAYDKKFGEHYATLAYCHTVEQYEAHDRISQLFVDDFDPDDAGIIDFLYQSDCEGSISYKTCKKIYDLIKDVDYSGQRFVYATVSDGKDYEHLKEFLRDCYRYHRKAYWR